MAYGTGQIPLQVVRRQLNPVQVSRQYQQSILFIIYHNIATSNARYTDHQHLRNAGAGQTPVPELV
jgi:hypothetical protein